MSERDAILHIVSVYERRRIIMFWVSVAGVMLPLLSMFVLPLEITRTEDKIVATYRYRYVVAAFSALAWHWSIRCYLQLPIEYLKKKEQHLDRLAVAIFFIYPFCFIEHLPTQALVSQDVFEHQTFITTMLFGPTHKDFRELEKIELTTDEDGDEVLRFYTQRDTNDLEKSRPTRARPDHEVSELAVDQFVEALLPDLKTQANRHGVKVVWND